MNENWIIGVLPAEEIGKFYRVTAHCANCGNSESIAVRKGIEKPRVITCPNCKCSTLKT